jgi:hypothetical protein
MKLGTTAHPKFRRLQRELGLPLYAVVGLLESLWMLAAQFAEDGDLSRFPSQEIADYTGYEGDATQLVETLIACRWLDRNDQELTIHDWIEHRPDYLADRMRKRTERAEKAKNTGISENHAGTYREDLSMSATVQDIPGKSLPNPTQPNQTKPIQTQPHQTTTQPISGDAVDWSVRWSVGVVEKSFVDSVVETANRFTRLKVKLDRELIWQVAWVGCEFDRDSINDACDRLKRPGEVSKPESYLRAMMRKICEDNGSIWDKIRRHVPQVPEPSKFPSEIEASTKC